MEKLGFMKTFSQIFHSYGVKIIIIVVVVANTNKWSSLGARILPNILHTFTHLVLKIALEGR